MLVVEEDGVVLVVEEDGVVLVVEEDGAMLVVEEVRVGPEGASPATSPTNIQYIPGDRLARRSFYKLPRATV